MKSDCRQTSKTLCDHFTYVTQFNQVKQTQAESIQLPAANVSVVHLRHYITKKTKINRLLKDK